MVLYDCVQFDWWFHRDTLLCHFKTNIQTVYVHENVTVQPIRDQTLSEEHGRVGPFMGPPPVAAYEFPSESRRQ